MRALNACGKQGQPSHFVRVSAQTGPLSGVPNPRMLKGARVVTKDASGNLLIFGTVRNAWQAGMATFVEVAASFFNGSQLVGTDSTFVSGRSRRLTSSRLVTDTALDAGETGCFAMFTDLARKRVKRVTLNTMFDDVLTEPLQGKVRRVGNLVKKNQAGDLKVSGKLRNAGNRPTYLNQITLDVRNAAGRVLDCDTAFVMGSRATLPNGVKTQTGLKPRAVMPFSTVTQAPFAKVDELFTWITWGENDTAQVNAASDDPQLRAWMLNYSSLRQELAMLGDAHPEVVTQRGRAEIRERLAAQVREIERHLNQP